MLRATTSLAQFLGVVGTTMKRASASCAGIATLAACLTVASPARATSPYLEIPDPAAAMQTPAYRYANMTDDEAYAELDRRSILYSRVGPVSGVRAPIRLTGRLHGVLIRSALPPEERASSIFEICDARLALALDDFAAILERHDVEEVVHYTMYRPNVPQSDAVANGGGIAKGNVAKGSIAKGSVANGSVANGSIAKGSVANGSVANGSVANGNKASSTSAKNAAVVGSEAAHDEASPDESANAGAALESRVGRPSKRRAFLDEKGTQGAKTHSGAQRGPNRSGESRHKELDSNLEPLEILADELEPTLTAVGAHLVEGGEGADRAKTIPQTPLAKAPTTLPLVAKAPAPKRWSAKPATTKSTKPGAMKGAGFGVSKNGPKPAAAFDDEQLHGKWAPPGTRHPAGLAIDVGSLKKKNGKILSVASGFEGKLGDRTCGPGAPVPESDDARELRSIVCEAHDAGVFTYTLTPNYNVAHRDHFHMEIKPGVLWFLYH